MLLAELRRDPMLALDANPDLGDLKDKLSDKSAPAALVDDLASWLDGRPGATPAELSGRLGVGPPRAAVHPNPPAPGRHPALHLVQRAAVLAGAGPGAGRPPGQQLGHTGPMFRRSPTPPTKRTTRLGRPDR
jgi:hypothetical protein